MKIPAVALHFGVATVVSVGLTYFVCSFYEVPEEQRIEELVRSNPKLSGPRRKQYEERMQTFFHDMKNNDEDQSKLFEDILKKGVKKSEDKKV